MKPEIERYLKEVQDAEVDYHVACKRFFAKAHAFEMQVIACMTGHITAQDAWWEAARLPEGRDALELYRAAGIERERAKYNLVTRVCALKAHMLE